MNNYSNLVVVVCSNTPFDSNPLGAKPLAIALSKKCEVLYVDPPLSYLTAVKQPALRSTLFKKRFSKVSSNLYRLTPVVFPGKDRLLINRLTSLLLRIKIKRSLKRISDGKKVMLIATAPHYRVFQNDYFNVYWMMDDYASQPELVGISPAILRAGQNFLAEQSDAIVAVSESLKEKLVGQNRESVLVTNGADSEAFRFPNFKENDLPSDIERKLPNSNFALYVGGISERIDVSYLQEVASDGSPIVIAGNIDPNMNRTDFDTICQLSNVMYLGSIPNEVIPGLMNKATVGLVPYANEPFNKASMPLKIPEYLLCGLIVVSTDLPFTTAFSNDDVYVGKTKHEFSELVKELLANPAFPSQRVMRSSRIAQEWSWDKKADEFLKLLT